MKPAKYSFLFASIFSLLLIGCQSRESKIKNAISESLRSHQQELFNVFHPIGTAESVKIHSIQVYGNTVDVVLTIYWQGPITTDGYTKVAMRYDGDVQRWTGYQIIATNGITNAQANEAAFDISYEIGRDLFDDR